MKMAYGFSQNTPTGLPTPLIKEIVLHPTDIHASPELPNRQPWAHARKHKQRITVRVMVPVPEQLDGDHNYPLNLYIRVLKSAPLIEAMRNQFRKANLTNFITSYSPNRRPDETVVSFAPGIREGNYLSWDRRAKIKYFFHDLEVPLEVNHLGLGGIGSLRNVALVLAVYSANSKPLRSGMMERFSHSSDPESNFKLGEILLQDIVVKSQIPLEAYYYTLNESVPGYGNQGDVWPGPVHGTEDEDGRLTIMVGDEHVVREYPTCTRASCANYKIKDLSFLSPESARYIPKLFVGVPRQKIDSPTDPPPELSSYFTSPAYSRQTGGASTAFLTFDYGAYLTETLDLSPLLNNIDSLLSCGDLNGIRVYRFRRSHQHESTFLTAGTDGPDPQCESPSAELVSNVQIVHTGPGPGRLGIFISDLGMASMPSGLYGYRIEMDIIDNSRRAVSEIIDKLTLELRTYENFLTRFDGRGKRSLGNYSFWRGNVKRLEQLSNHKRLIDLLLASIKFFGTRNPMLANFKNELLSLSSPYSATPETLLMFKELVADYLNCLINVLDENVQNADRVRDINSKIFGASYSIDERLSYEVPKAYYNHSHNGRELGFDYFGSTYTEASSTDPLPLGPLQSVPSILSSEGLLRVSHDNLIARLTIEQNKYRVADINSLSLNKFGFLSPLVMRTPQDSIPVVPTSGTRDQFLPFDMSLSILEANKVEISPVKDFGGSVRKKKNLDYFRSNLLGELGVSVKPKKVSLRQIAGTTPNQAINFIDSALYFSTGSLFTQSDEKNVQVRTGSTETLIDQAVNEERDMLNLPVVKYLLQQQAQEYVSNVYITKQDLIRGSFPYVQLTHNSGAMDNLNIFEKNVDWNSFAAIEYVSGFNHSGGPNWSVLNRSIFNRSKTQNTTLLCRLRRLPSVFNVSNAFDLPIYNELFLLGTGGTPFRGTAPLRQDPAEPHRYVAQYSKYITEVQNLKGVFVMERKGIFSEWLSSPSTLLAAPISQNLHPHRTPRAKLPPPRRGNTGSSAIPRIPAPGQPEPSGPSSPGGSGGRGGRGGRGTGGY